MDTVIDRLEAVGLSLPKPPNPNGDYVPFTRTGNMLFLAGQTCTREGQLLYSGTIGADMSIEDGQKAAGACALNLLSVLSLACEGDFERVRALKVNGFVRCASDFTEVPRVIDGASKLFLLALGERGRHARAAIGAYALPRGASVEVEAVFEIDGPRS